MKIKTSELTGAALNWAVAKCEGFENNLFRGVVVEPTNGLQGALPRKWQPSTNWFQGGPIIEREGVSVITLERGYGVDSEGYTTSKRIPVFGAVIGEYFDTDHQRNSYGESYGEIYYIREELVATGPTPLIAAMRCYVASKLGDEAEVPNGLE